MPNHGPSRILAWLPWLLATPLAAAAPPSAPSFAEAWYREVMEGNIAQAARDYEQIYLSQPSDKVTDAIREKAALRAGICFERLGQPRSASPAWSWLLKAATPAANPVVTPAAASNAAASPAASSVGVGTASAALRSEALLRSLRLSGSGSAASFSDAPPDPTVEKAVQAAVEALRAALRARTNEAAALLAASARYSRRIAARQELLARLEARGLGLIVPGAAPDFGTQTTELADLIRSAVPQEADAQRVIAGLLDRAFSRTLDALAAPTIPEAWDATQEFLAVQGGAASAKTDPRTQELHEIWSHAILSDDGSSRIAQQWAVRRAYTDDLAKRIHLVQEIHVLLDGAAAAESRGRRDQALPQLERIRELSDWSLPELRREAEVRILTGQAALRYLALAARAAGADQLEPLWRDVRRETESVSSQASQLADGVLAEYRLRGPARPEGARAAAGWCRDEVGRRLAQARSALARRDASLISGAAQDAASAADLLTEARSAIAAAGILLEWVPAAAEPGVHDELTSLLKAMPPEAVEKSPAATGRGQEATKPPR